MSTPAPEEPAAQDAGAVAAEMRLATERLREQAWMVAGMTRPALDDAEADQLAP